ncbi:MAG: hypothetical protein ABI406_21210 [Ktedonobacteraceae bacterium]
MTKPVSRGFTQWVVGVLCFSLLFGVAAFISPSAHAATRSVSVSQAVHSHVHAPVRHSIPNCVISRQLPNSCYGCSWDQIASASYGRAGSGYYKAVFVYAEYDNYSGTYCGYIAVQGELDQPPHQQVSTLNATLYGGCGGSCLSNTIQVYPNNYYNWWFTNWVSTYYVNYNSCLTGAVFYLQLPGTYTNCVDV